MMLFFVAAAFAAGAADVLPVLAPTDAPAQYAEWLKTSGKPDDPLACDAVWPKEALLCFKIAEKGAIRWVTASDLTVWKVNISQLRTQVIAASDAKLVAPEEVRVEGVRGKYWLYAQKPWSAGAVLNPEHVARDIGEPSGQPFLAAAPVDGVVIVWLPGEKELDRVIAVGVREMFDTQDGPVTAVIQKWTGSRWETFGEAVPKQPPSH